jgi:OOP family OmpA-OmpF porin
VADFQDRCPNTPAGTAVDAVGCTRLFEAEGKALVLQGVNFATGTATLAEDSRGILDRVAESLVADTDVRVEVDGHTDNCGRAATNRRLSQPRAVAIRDDLVSRGVLADRVTARGFGSSRPIAPIDTPEGRAQNRPVGLVTQN